MAMVLLSCSVGVYRVLGAVACMWDGVGEGSANVGVSAWVELSAFHGEWRRNLISYRIQLYRSWLIDQPLCTGPFGLLGIYSDTFVLSCLACVYLLRISFSIVQLTGYFLFIAHIMHKFPFWEAEDTARRSL